MKTTSIAGSTFTARSMSTASVIDAVMQRCGANVSTANWMIFEAGSRSNSSLSSASSRSVKSMMSTGVSTRAISVTPMRQQAVGRGAASGGALGLAGLGHVGPGLAEVDVEVRGVVGHGELVELLEVGGDLLDPADAVHPPAERLPGLARVLGGQPQGALAEVDLGLPDVAAEQHGVPGCRLAVRPAFGTGEPDVGDVVLAARVGAAGDVGADAADLGEALLLEALADGV